MKIWHGYGSDHSASLVMIGEFRTEQDAKRVYELITTLMQQADSDLATGVFEHWTRNEQLSESTEDTLRGLQLFHLSPSDIADFAFLNPWIDITGSKLTLKSDDVEIGGFVKLMVAEGAKVQVYSSHEYPNDQDKDTDEAK